MQLLGVAQHGMAWSILSLHGGCEQCAVDQLLYYYYYYCFSSLSLRGVQVNSPYLNSHGFMFVFLLSLWWSE